MTSHLTAAASVLAFAAVLGAGICSAATSSASPVATGYPDTSGYTPVSSVEIYRAVNEPGVWFISPLGVRCAIEDDGSYGCSGALAGTPPNHNEIAWFAGDPFPRLYHSAEPRFSSAAGQMVMIMSTSITYRGTRCAVTPESAVYCMHRDDPNSQIMVTSSSTSRGGDPLAAR